MSGQEGQPTLQASSWTADAAVSLPLPSILNQLQNARPESRRKMHVALIDEFSLRRASTLNLLRRQGHENALSFGSVDELLAHVGSDIGTLSGVIICVGARSVAEPPVQAELQRSIAAFSPIPIVVLSDRDESKEALTAFRHGVRGYIPTSLEPCLAVEALRIVLAGGAFLPADMLIRARRHASPGVAPLSTHAPISMDRREPWPPRQLAVLRLLAQGKANKEIARALEMEESTVKVHVRHIMRKLGVTNRTQAALHARRLGLPVMSRAAHESAAEGAAYGSLSTSPPVGHSGFTHPGQSS